MPVDIYVGGAEHAVLHLLYARFWIKVLHDAGYLPFNEPFKKLYNQGLILGPDGMKMSKSKGNVINPDDVVAEFGADSLRLYEMFMGPFEVEKPWDTKSINGVFRFLQKVWALQGIEKGESSSEIKNLLAKTIKKVTNDIENFQFNTAVSAMMIVTNKMSKQKTLAQSDLEVLLKILNPFAPHITEEMWSQLGHEKVLVFEPWPAYDEKAAQDTEVEIAIQINGKVRARITVETAATQEQVSVLAKANEAVKKHIEGKEIAKEIYVPGRLLSIVVK